MLNLNPKLTISTVVLKLISFALFFCPSPFLTWSIKDNSCIQTHILYHTQNVNSQKYNPLVKRYIHFKQIAIHRPCHITFLPKLTESPFPSIVGNSGKKARCNQLHILTNKMTLRCRSTYSFLCCLWLLSF